MKKVVPILDLETDIKTLLSGLGTVFLETQSDTFNADNVSDPVILIQNGGYRVTKAVGEGVGVYNSQVLTSIWIVSIVCRKEDYLTLASPLIMSVINVMKSYRPPNHRHKFRIIEDSKDFARPTMSNRVALYPFYFGINIIV